MKSLSFLLFCSLLLGSCALSGPLDTNEMEGENEEKWEEEMDVSESSEVSLQVGLIALEDNGESGPLVGCGDSLVFVTQSVAGPMTGEEQVQAALEALFAIKDPSYGQSGLYTALDEASLTVDSVVLDASTLTVELSGTLSSGGTCDDPRIVEQIKETASSNARGQAQLPLEVTVLINGKSLEEQLNAKGE